MNRTHIPWSQVLEPYPGGTTRQKLAAACAGKTYRELSRELGQDVNAVKSFIYRSSTLQPRFHVVSARPRPNYALILGSIIRLFAQEQGFEEAEYREWIKGDGMMDFARRCAELKIPLFICQYREESCGQGEKV